ncbi:hypothetical protein ABKV19_014301 [Rosa sericea]
MWVPSITLSFPRKLIQSPRTNLNHFKFINWFSSCSLSDDDNDFCTTNTNTSTQEVYGGGIVCGFKWASPQQPAIAHCDSRSSECAGVSSVTDCTTDIANAKRNRLVADLETLEVVNKLNGFKSKPNSAFSLFRQLKEDGFQHNVLTYCALVRILCYWRLDRKLDSLFSEVISGSRDVGFRLSDLLELGSDGGGNCGFPVNSSGF